jgi:hypothetical protein
LLFVQVRPEVLDASIPVLPRRDFAGARIDLYTLGSHVIHEALSIVAAQNAASARVQRVP